MYTPSPYILINIIEPWLYDCDAIRMLRCQRGTVGHINKRKFYTVMIIKPPLIADILVYIVKHNIESVEIDTNRSSDISTVLLYMNESSHITELRINHTYRYSSTGNTWPKKLKKLHMLQNEFDFRYFPTTLESLSCMTIYHDSIIFNNLTKLHVCNLFILEFSFQHFPVLVDLQSDTTPYNIIENDPNFIHTLLVPSRIQRLVLETIYIDEVQDERLNRDELHIIFPKDSDIKEFHYSSSTYNTEENYIVKEIRLI